MLEVQRTTPPLPPAESFPQRQDRVLQHERCDLRKPKSLFEAK
jgi:hypothetical protein